MYQKLHFACRGNRISGENYETSIQYICLDLDSNLLIQNTNLTFKTCPFFKKVTSDAESNLAGLLNTDLHVNLIMKQIGDIYLFLILFIVWFKAYYFCSNSKYLYYLKLENKISLQKPFFTNLIISNVYLHLG